MQRDKYQYIVTVEFLRTSILTTFQEKQKTVVVFLHEDIFGINHLYQIYSYTG